MGLLWKVPRAPRRRKAADLLDRPWFLEEMRGAGHDFKLHGGRQMPHRVPIELDDRSVGPADDEQGRGLHVRQRVTGEIGPAAAPVLAPKQQIGSPAISG